MYARASDFHEGLAAVGSKERYDGFVDYDGNLKVAWECMYVSNFSEGVAWVTPDDESYRQILIDRDGAVVLGSAVSSASPYFHGLSLVTCERTNEYWDRHGETVWTSEYVKMPFDAKRPPLSGMPGGPRVSQPVRIDDSV